MKRLLLAAFFALGLALPSQAQTVIVASCPSATGVGGSAGSTGRPYAIDVNGNVCIEGSLSATTSGTGANNADAVASVATGLVPVADYMFVYNGTTWDRLRGDTTNGAFVNVKTSVLPTGAALDASITTTNTDLGPPGATACATDTGSCSVNALLQRLAQRISTLITGPLPITLPATPSIANLSGMVQTPSSETLAAVAHSTSVTTAESCRVLKASAGNLFALRVSIAATSGYVMVFDATSAPVDGAVTTLAIPAVRIVSDGTSGWYADDFQYPVRMATGITVCFSSTGPFSKTASATAAISGQVQ